MKNASSWVRKGYLDVDDFIQSASLHILNRSASYDPEHGTPFKTWVCVVLNEDADRVHFYGSEDEFNNRSAE